MADEIKWHLTQNGIFTGYKPEFRMKVGDVSTDWRSVRIKSGKKGVPYPTRFGGVLNTIGLFGMPQAKALGYSFVADFEANPNEIGSIEIRIIEYEVVYDIKARKV